MSDSRIVQEAHLALIEVAQLARQGAARLQSVLEKLPPERVVEELMAEGIRPHDAIYHLRGVLQINLESLESTARELGTEAGPLVAGTHRGGTEDSLVSRTLRRASWNS